MALLTWSHPAPSLDTVETALRAGTGLLAAAGVPSPAADAELLLAHICGVRRGRVQAWALQGRGMTAIETEEFRSAVQRRADREPLQHITGLAPFRSIELRVGRGVFVPRPETEVLVTEAVAALPAGGMLVDLGTGSGAIALSVAQERPDARVVAVEGSSIAYTWAEGNRRRLGLQNVRIVHGDFGDPAVLASIGPAADVVVSNPPYVPVGAVPRDPEVRAFDPEMALYSGVDGLDAIRAIARGLPAILRQGGWAFLEHGEQQGAPVRAVLGAAGLSRLATSRDLTGRDRVTSGLLGRG